MGHLRHRISAINFHLHGIMQLIRGELENKTISLELKISLTRTYSGPFGTNK